MTTRPAKLKRPAAKKQGAWEGKTPSERKKSKRKGDPSGSAVGFAMVSVKMRPTERAELKRVCDKLGITPNKAMRIMARRSCGFLELREKSLENLETVTQQIIGVSRNINQIAKAANRTCSPDYIAFMEDRKELTKELRSLTRMLRGITNAARRRTDGMEQLKEMSAS